MLRHQAGQPLARIVSTNLRAGDDFDTDIREY
jgi:hypothetical protein